MRKKIKLIALVIGLTMFYSCSRYIVPPFTDVSKISQIRTGMKAKQVADVLGIDPYDVYYMQETGAQLLSFNYRLKKRIMYIYNTVNYMEVGRRTSDENSQKDGEIYYDKDYRTLFAMFSPQGDLTSYLTTDGVNDKGRLIVLGNTLKLYDDKNTTLLDSTYNKAFTPFYNKATYINFEKDGRMSDPDAGSKRPGLFRRLFRFLY